MYQVVNNNSNELNHKEVIEKLTSQSEHLIIASPFLMVDFDAFFKNVDLKKLNTIKLISTLEPKSYNQLKKIKSLKSFAQSKILKQNKVKVQISINDKLHGKIYIFNTKKEKKAIITSANFTDSGLEKNHEWGILTTDSDIIDSISNQLTSTSEITKLTLSEIEHLENKCEEYFKDKAIPSKSGVKLDLTKLLRDRRIGDRINKKVYDYTTKGFDLVDQIECIIDDKKYFLQRYYKKGKSDKIRIIDEDNSMIRRGDRKDMLRKIIKTYKLDVFLSNKPGRKKSQKGTTPLGKEVIVAMKKKN